VNGPNTRLGAYSIPSYRLTLHFRKYPLRLMFWPVHDVIGRALLHGEVDIWYGVRYVAAKFRWWPVSGWRIALYNLWRLAARKGK